MAGPFRILARQVWIKADDRKPPIVGEAITPKTVQAASSDTGAEAINLINRSGLRNRDADALDEHSADPAHAWRSAKGETVSWVEFDLGEVQSLGSLCVWNYNDSWFTDRGVRKADISVWTPEAGWKKVCDDQPLEQAQGSDDYDTPIFVKLDGVKAQKVRLDDLASFGDTEFIGLSEVQFFASLGPQAVRPNPPDGAIGVNVSDLELMWTAGERATSHSIYLGISPDDLKPLGRIEQVAAKVSQLNNDTKYYWRIDEACEDGSVAIGKVWSFTTGGFAAWWKLDETESTAVADSSGGGHNGVIHGDPTWQPAGGRVGGALQFDGVDDYVDTGWIPNLPTWTVAAWIKSPAAPKSPTASGPVHCENNFQINWDHGSDQFRGAAGVRVGETWYGASFGELKGETWYHLAATYDGENFKAYRDGALITDNTGPSGRADSQPETLKFGRHARVEDAFFAGTIDDICVFAYALGADEIKALHSGTEPTAIAGRAAPSEPRLLQPTLAALAGPVAQAQPQAQIQPVSASDQSAASGQSAGKVGNLIAFIVVLAVVGLIVGISLAGKQRTQQAE